MSFGGGGGGALPTHVHNAVPLQGGPLDFANDTISSMNAGSTTFSNGAALQELTIGNAGETLTVNGGGTAPEWAAGGGAGEVCYSILTLGEDGLRNDIPLYGVQITNGSSPVHGKTLTDVSFWLRKLGGQTPTGDGYVYIYDSAGVLQATSDSPIAWENLTGSWTKYTFNISHTVDIGDRIAIGGGTTGLNKEVSFYGDQTTSQTTFQSLVYYATSTGVWTQWGGGTSGARWCFNSS